jgi:hypothetical protein
VLRTSTDQIDTQQQVDNCLRVLAHLRVKRLVTIGGSNMTNSVYKLAQGIERSDLDLTLTHVPKSIYMDLPLPQGSLNYGFQTARHVGTDIVNRCAVQHRMTPFRVAPERVHKSHFISLCNVTQQSLPRRAHHAAVVLCRHSRTTVSLLLFFLFFLFVIKRISRFVA